jgi:hypothetical protein
MSPAVHIHVFLPSVEEEGPDERWHLCLGLDTIETRNEEQGKYTVLFVEPRRTGSHQIII